MSKDDPNIHVYVEPFRFRFIVVRFSSRPSGVEKKGQEGDTRGDTYPRAIIFTRLSPLDPCVILRGRGEGEARARLNHLTAAITLEFIPIPI